MSFKNQENISIAEEDDLEFDMSGLLADEYKNSSHDSNELSHEQKLKRIEQYKMEIENKEYSTKSVLKLHPVKDAHELRKQAQELRKKVLDNNRKEVDDPLPNPEQRK